MSPKPGDTVSVHYTGKLSDGEEFDSSEGKDPLKFTVGSGEVIPGFDHAVTHLEIGETAIVTIPSDEAYGERDPQAMRKVERAMFGDEEPQEGWMIELGTPDGQRVAALIAEVDDEEVLLDFNHPLAGEDLTFEITLVEVEEAE